MAKKIIFLFLAGIFFFAGCATVPEREAFSTYNINGATYFPLISLCQASGIDWQYDTFSKTFTLNKNAHKISLRVGDNLVLVDGQPQNLNHPVDLYEGTIAVPYRFKTDIFDVLFKEFYPESRRAALLALKIRKIVIDAGHGGNDPGAISRKGLKEKDVNLDIAKRLSAILRTAGVEVVMTRNSDRFIPLPTRINIANRSRPDLFLSIHANANHTRSLRGFEVYYVSPGTSDSQRAWASAKSEALNFEGFSFAGSSLNLRATLWDMFYTYSRAESIELSRSLCRAMDTNLGVRVLGIKPARFVVLKGVYVPAALVEVGFLSNYEEERMLTNSYYRQKIAEALASGIQDYARDFIIMEVAKR